MIYNQTNRPLWLARGVPLAPYAGVEPAPWLLGTDSYRELLRAGALAEHPAAPAEPGIANMPRTKAKVRK